MPGTTTSSSAVSFHFLAPVHLKNRRKLKEFLLKLFAKEKTPVQSLTYIFCSDAYLLNINQSFLQHDDYTDIITFNLSEHSQPVTGEIYISVDRVRENANKFETSLNQELHRVIFHGALHLCGYKDKTREQAAIMRTMENRCLTEYGK